MFMLAPIRAFKWQKFFEGVTDIRTNVVNLFYKGETYTVVKQERVYFRQK